VKQFVADDRADAAIVKIATRARQPVKRATAAGKNLRSDENLSPVSQAQENDS
jgi:hypothetical protein